MGVEGKIQGWVRISVKEKSGKGGVGIKMRQEHR